MVDERQVQAEDGTALHVTSYGQPSAAPPVVCVPGLTRNARDFTRVAKAVSHDRLVLALDLRGRGRSGMDPTGESYRVGVYVRDVIAVLDAVGVGRAVFVGTSLGGLVSMSLAAWHHDRVAALVLNDIGPKLESEGFARIQSYAGKLPPVSTWDDVVRQLQVLNEPMVGTIDDEEWLRMAHDQWREFGPGDLRPDHDPAVAAGMATADPHAIPTTWEVFDAMAPVPILVIRGAESDLFSASTADEMRRRHPGLEVVTIPDRGHAPTLDEPESRAAIAAFLARLADGGGHA